MARKHLTCGDLCVEEHGGWSIVVEDPGLWTGKRHIDLGSTKKAVRRWTNKEGPQVGLLDVSPEGTHDGLFVGTEHHYPPSSRVVLLEPLTAAARRRARAQSLDANTPGRGQQR